MWGREPQPQPGCMYNSDYLYGYVQRQRHEELLGEAAERRLARTARVVKQRPALAWWRRLVGLAQPTQTRTAECRPARLQSARY